MTAEELYKVYSQWTGQLHFWVERRLGRHIDCEYFPDSYQFAVYAGRAEMDISQSGIMNLVRPRAEKSLTLDLPKPEDDPTQADLDRVFRQICFAAARVLELDLGNLQLGESTMSATPSDTRKEHPPCPFCGDQYPPRVHHRADEDIYVVICSNCSASGPPGESMEEAWEGWDERLGE